MNKERSSTLAAVAMVMLASMLYFYDYIVRTAPAAIAPHLLHEFQLTAFDLTKISSIFYLIYLVMQIPVGMVYDRFGAKYPLLFSMTSCALFTIMFACAQSTTMIFWSRLLLGWVSAFAMAGPLILAAQWLPHRYYSIAAGLVQLMGSLGGFLGGSFIAHSTLVIGWRMTMVWIGAIGAVLSLLFLVFIHEKPAEKNTKSKHFCFSQFLWLLRQPIVWYIGLIGCFSYVPMILVAELWGPLFLHQTLATPMTHATDLLLSMWIGNMIGGPLFAWISEALHKRKGPLALAFIMTLWAGIQFTYGDNTATMIVLLALIMGIASSAGTTLTFSLVHDFLPQHVLGTAIGFNNMIIVFSVFSQYLAGYLLSHYSGASNDYTVQDFRLAFMVMPICMAIGTLIITFLIPETHCQRHKSTDADG